MSLSRLPILMLSASVISLAACTAPDGTPRTNTNEGALIGGIFGGLIGSTAGGNKARNVIAGAAAGAIIGGAIGLALDQQEEALRSSLGNDQVGIVNTGSELIVTLPEAITFDTGSDFVRDSLFSDLGSGFDVVQ